MRDDKLCFVQFMHPGREHDAGPGNVLAWNRGEHRRKFMRGNGRCVRGQAEHIGQLEFWGEWEPQSEIVDRFRNPLPFGPKRVHQPFYEYERSYVGLQNTDPFVFGGFFYTGCQQHTKRGPTQLRYLAPGSVILFGSRVDGSFALDTVFVVRDYVDHDASNYRQRVFPQIPPVYRDVTFGPWYANTPSIPERCVDPALSFRLYFGVAKDEASEGMFSFFPAMPAPTDRGFQRPIIDIDTAITPSLAQGKRLNPQPSKRAIVHLWHQVVGQVEAQGLWLGTHAECSARRELGLGAH